MKLGMIGLDTSHCTAFTELLHNGSHPYHVPIGKVVAAFPGGSPDIELSRNRVPGFQARLADEYGVRMVDSPAAVAEEVDAIFLESMDGKVHLQQFKEIALYGKPVFIDKPLALTHADALAIRELAEKYNVPVMSSSALRFSASMQAWFSKGGRELVKGVDCFGPMPFEPSQPGLFWYGVHTVEMLYTLMGPGCESVTAAANPEHEVITAVWKDGRIATVRGWRSGEAGFSAVVHTDTGADFIADTPADKPFYACLLEKIGEFFTTGNPCVSLDETIEIIQFIEAANQSRESGQQVKLG